ncbi:MAG TPA: ferritin family protein [Candidatus Ozemobacteraceae bacterium]|nr:ferritin family protein [Candidatus Ozemobacteraceae bacterium]
MAFIELQEMMARAISFEKQMATFYGSVLSRVTVESSRKTIERLVAEEGKHALKLMEFRPHLPGAGVIQFPPDMPALPSPDDFLASGSDVAALLKAAIKLEQEAEGFYGRLADASPAGSVRELFTALRNFEKGHIDLLTRELAYL